MSKTYKAKVNQTHDFSFDENKISALNSIEKLNDSYHVLHDNTSFKAKVVTANFNEKKYVVQVNGNDYEVNISNELDSLIAELGLEASVGKKENDVKAPMPGLVVAVNVEVGQKVKEGEGVLVLEAMKMENTLLAPKDGVIKSIAVQGGDKVEKNELLIEIE